MIEQFDPLKGEMLRVLDDKGGVRKLAQELGVDVASVRGTGPEGRITEEDIRAVKVKTTPPLCLSFDHRVIDGAEAARFTKDLVGLLENPEPR